MNPDDASSGLQQLLDTPDLAGALESDRFKLFLDQVPVAIAVSALIPAERVVYANLAFLRLTGQANANILAGGWDILPGKAAGPEESPPLGQVVTIGHDYLGTFHFRVGEDVVTVDAWSNLIEGDDGIAAFRLVALVQVGSRETVLDELEALVQEKDTQLRELQHRVKNNLQMITALIRIEARGVPDRSTGDGFDRLAGRVEALGLLYRALAESSLTPGVDLGTYLGDIATAVMRAHGTEGVHLDLQIDTWPASIDVAMPTGLVVNELMINALKHAFVGREGGTISLHCTGAPDGSHQVLIADDGVGLPEGAQWPKPGKLSALIVRSLLQNARAKIHVQSAPGEGVQVTIDFSAS